MYPGFFKRAIDLLVSLILLTLALPLLVIAAIVLFFANNGKVFFTQERPGRKNRLFRVIKFKTMNDKKDANGKLLGNTLLAIQLTIVQGTTQILL